MCAVLENMKCGVFVGERCIKVLKHADDTTLISKSLEEMTEMLRKVVKESVKFGLKLNLTKMNVMVIVPKVNKPLKINGKIITQVQVFNYFRSYICTEG